MTNTLPMPLSIGSCAIRQDADARFCLNDLHQAAGGEKRHTPNYWLAVDQTKALIEEIRKPLIQGDTGIPVSPQINHIAPVSTTRGGKGPQGTYVVRELVYAYAMWISPRFHLQVIRAFDALRAQPAGTAAPAGLAPDEYRELLERKGYAIVPKGQAAEAAPAIAPPAALAAAQAELLRLIPRLDTLRRCVRAGLTEPQIAAALGVSRTTIGREKARLRACGLLVAEARAEPGPSPKAPGRGRGKARGLCVAPAP